MISEAPTGPYSESLEEAAVRALSRLSHPNTNMLENIGAAVAALIQERRRLAREVLRLRKLAGMYDRPPRFSGPPRLELVPKQEKTHASGTQ